MRAPTALALLAFVGWTLAAAGSASADTETLTVKPGKANEVISETVFEKGKAYDVRVSGSIRFPSNDERNPRHLPRRRAVHDLPA